MPRRLFLLLSAFALLWGLTTPALARTRVVAQKSSKQPLGNVFLRANLASGHVYRVQVTASGHQPFTGYGTEQAVGVANGRLFTAPASLTLKGTTPRSFTVRQPAPGKLSEWVLVVQIRLTRGKNLTVRVLDLGKQ